MSVSGVYDPVRNLMCGGMCVGSNLSVSEWGVLGVI